jgi:hypothetical protein
MPHQVRDAAHRVANLRPGRALADAVPMVARERQRHAGVHHQQVVFRDVDAFALAEDVARLLGLLQHAIAVVLPEPFSQPQRAEAVLGLDLLHHLADGEAAAEQGVGELDALDGLDLVLALDPSGAAVPGRGAQQPTDRRHHRVGDGEENRAHTICSLTARPAATGALQLVPSQIPRMPSSMWTWTRPWCPMA